MALNLKIDVVTTNFDNMLNDMAQIDPTVEFRTIVIQMALRVMEQAAKRTRAASVTDIKRSEARRMAMREWMTVDGKKYLISGTGTEGHMNHYPDALWGALQAKLAADSKARVAIKSAEAGLAKQSWLHLAQQLGGTIDVPGYVQTANYKGRQYPGDVSHEETSSDGKYGLTIINSSPIVQEAGGLAALLGAMQGQVGYFRQNMAHGFAETLAKRAAKYPGIFVKQG